MNDRKIPVVLAAGADFIVPTYISIYSMLKNADPDRMIDVYVFSPGDYSNDAVVWLKDLEKKFQNARITIVDMGDKYRDVNIKLAHVRYPTFYRLSIPKILSQYDKCIYLDSDVVVEGNIAEYYDIDMEGFCIAGARDIGFSEKESIERMKLLNIDGMDTYINSGSLLMNLKEIRAMHIEDALEQGAYKYYPCVDQDVFNSLCFGKVKVISLRYNAMTRYTYYGNKECREIYGEEYYFEAVKQPVVVHYIGGKVKPWVSRFVLAGSLWWKYVNELNVDERKTFVNPFITECKPSLRLKSAVLGSSLLKKIGLYDGIMKVMKETGIFKKIKKRL